MGKSKARRRDNTDKTTRDVDSVFRKLGLPTSDSTSVVVGSIVGALPAGTLDAFDEAENNEAARMPIIFSSPLAALWLGVGLRAPMVRAQLPWIVDQLTARGIGPGSRVLDVGSGCGLTAAVVESLVGCHVIGIDPQPGSVTAGQWMNERVGANVEFLQMPPEDLPDAGLGAFDAVIAQTAITYTQPEPCRDMRRGRPAFLAVIQDPTPVTDDTQVLLDTAAQAGLLLVCDHDQPSLWGYLGRHAGNNNLVPDWESLQCHEFELPLGDDRQVCLAFVPGTPDSSDLDQLFTTIGD